MFIQDMASCVPDTRVPLETFCAGLGLPNNQVQVLKRYHGLRQIPVAEGMNYYQLMYEPVRQILERNDPSKIKYLIHICVNPAWPFAHSVLARIKEEAKIWDAECFSVSIHECASTVEALKVAQLLLKDEAEDAQALILASDWDFRPARGLPNIPVTGDGGAALLLSKNFSDHRLLAAETTANIEFAMGIWKDTKEDIDYQKRFFEMVEQNVQSTLKAAGLTMKDIKRVIPLNSSVTSLWMLAKHFGVEKDVFFTKNISEMTHMFGADVIINLETALKDGAIQKGDYYLFFLIGASGSFGSAAFQY